MENLRHISPRSIDTRKEPRRKEIRRITICIRGLQLPRDYSGRGKFLSVVGRSIPRSEISRQFPQPPHSSQIYPTFREYLSNATVEHRRKKSFPISNRWNSNTSRQSSQQATNRVEIRFRRIAIESIEEQPTGSPLRHSSNFNRKDRSIDRQTLTQFDTLVSSCVDKKLAWSSTLRHRLLEIPYCLKPQEGRREGGKRRRNDGDESGNETLAEHCSKSKRSRPLFTTNNGPTRGAPGDLFTIPACDVTLLSQVEFSSFRTLFPIFGA